MNERPHSWEAIVLTPEICDNLIDEAQDKLRKLPTQGYMISWIARTPAEFQGVEPVQEFHKQVELYIGRLRSARERLNSMLLTGTCDILTLANVIAGYSAPVCMHKRRHTTYHEAAGGLVDDCLEAFSSSFKKARSGRFLITDPGFLRSLVDDLYTSSRTPPEEIVPHIRREYAQVCAQTELLHTSLDIACLADVSFFRDGTFQYGEEFKCHESRTIEFKQVIGRNPIGSISKAVVRYAICLLNSNGGSVWWGVRDSDHVIVGVSLTDRERDRLVTTAYDKLASIHPPVDPTAFKVLFFRVSDAPKDAENCYLVKLEVPASLSGTLHRDTRGEAYARVEGSCRKLSSEEQIDWLRRRSLEPSSKEEAEQ